MSNVYPRMLLLAIAAVLTICSAAWGTVRMKKETEEINKEQVFSDYGFTREVFENCPIEKVVMDADSEVVHIYFPREEYRDLRHRLEHRGWAEQGWAAAITAWGQTVSSSPAGR